jgi:hypothetical protein
VTARELTGWIWWLVYIGAVCLIASPDGAVGAVLGSAIVMISTRMRDEQEWWT